MYFLGALSEGAHHLRLWLSKAGRQDIRTGGTGLDLAATRGSAIIEVLPSVIGGTVLVPMPVVE